MFHRAEDERNVTFKMKVIKFHKSAFERQIHESVIIQSRRADHNIKNSEAEYNRCAVPRLSVKLGSRNLKETGLEEELQSEQDLEDEIKIMKRSRKFRTSDEMSREEPKRKRIKLEKTEDVGRKKVERKITDLLLTITPSRKRAAEDSLPGTPSKKTVSECRTRSPVEQAVSKSLEEFRLKVTSRKTKPKKICRVTYMLKMLENDQMTKLFIEHQDQVVIDCSSDSRSDSRNDSRSDNDATSDKRSDNDETSDKKSIQVTQVRSESVEVYQVCPKAQIPSSIFTPRQLSTAIPPTSAQTELIASEFASYRAAFITNNNKKY